MHAFQPETFAALSPAKAKAAALALFDSAMIEPAADWRGVAYALHSVVTRKRGAAAGPISDDIAMQDAADASEFAAWADYPATGKAANIARGRVTVTFADGWSKTVGMLAGRTAKGRKPWSIAHAVRFAVICYEENAARYGHFGAIPEIVSVISADSSETVEGDLIWNPCEANAATLDARAGRVDLATYERPDDAPFNDEPCAVTIARAAAILDRQKRNRMIGANHEAACRAAALLDPWHRGAHNAEQIAGIAAAFASIMNADPEGYPYQRATFTARAVPSADKATVAATREIMGPYALPPIYGQPYSPCTPDHRAVMIEDALLAWPAREEIVEPRAPADHETMLLAGEIVGDIPDADAFAESLCLPYAARFTLVEDALLAWPAILAPCVAVDGEPVEIVATSPEPQEADATVAAPIVAVEPPEPARKPRYRYSPISGAWEIVPPVDEAMPLAA